MQVIQSSMAVNMHLAKFIVNDVYKSILCIKTFIFIFEYKYRTLCLSSIVVIRSQLFKTNDVISKRFVKNPINTNVFVEKNVKSFCTANVTLMMF